MCTKEHKGALRTLKKFDKSTKDLKFPLKHKNILIPEEKCKKNKIISIKIAIFIMYDFGVITGIGLEPTLYPGYVQVCEFLNSYNIMQMKEKVNYYS